MRDYGHKIDFVIPWVDGEDPRWLRDKNSYSVAEGDDNRDIRYRTWGTLRYWFRSVEMYAPWVNNIYFITYGHLPKWLNIDHPKLKIVRHEDFIPKHYLPTFNSHTIELNLHRIDGLSKNFVYFNDDIFLMKDVKPNDFFENGIPKDTAAFNLVTPRQGEFSHILVSTVSIINKYFDKKTILKNNLRGWFNLRYGSLLFRTILLLPWTHNTGFYNHHLSVSYDKETFYEVWEREQELLDTTSKNKFRHELDVNQYIFRYWQLAKGQFIPTKPMGKSVTLTNDLSIISKEFNSKSNKMICLNDSQYITDFDIVKNHIISLFEKKFPKQSTFELKEEVIYEKNA